MKIKSWNGEKVEARGRMVVCQRQLTDFNPVVAYRDVIKVIDRFSSNAIVFSDKSWTSKSHAENSLTMLHCPFQVGDELEVFDDEWFDAFGTERWANWNLGFPSKEMMKRFKFRHANPALHDAPEYKP